MAKINLLPHREERRREQRSAFILVCVIVAGVSLLLVMAWSRQITAHVALQNQRNELIDAESAKLDEDIKTIDDLQKKKKDLLKRMQVIEELQGRRPIIVRVFDEMVRVMPNGVYLTDFERHGDAFHINGIADTNGDVSALMRNIQSSPWFKNATLNNVQAIQGPGGQSARDDSQNLRKNAFSMDFALHLPDSVNNAGAGKAQAGAKKGGSGA